MKTALIIFIVIDFVLIFIILGLVVGYVNDWMVKDDEKRIKTSRRKRKRKGVIEEQKPVEEQTIEGQQLPIAEPVKEGEQK